MPRQLRLTSLVLIFIPLTFSVNAQDWPETDQKEFINSCVSEASDAMGENVSRQYCHCMLFKIMDLYDTPDAASGMTEAEVMPMAKACLSFEKWPEGTQMNFFNSCYETGKEELGEELSNNYCNCMLYRLTVLFPDPDDYSLTEDELNDLAIECLLKQ